LYDQCFAKAIVQWLWKPRVTKKMFIRIAKRKITLPKLKKMYLEKEKITVMTAYDYPTGRICEEAGVDMTLVGDSLAMVCLGMKSTNQITLEVKFF
jgi:3-methyl-2-oxobutanoate hydroxymethyltransferase